MFAQFQIQSPKGTAEAHWANVDTGSMVNICYSGALDEHPTLRAYYTPYAHVVQGVGQKTTQVIGKLSNVPISLCPMNASTPDIITTTFYILECPTYHFILGLQLLVPINGGVFCGTQTLTYTPPNS